MSMKEKSIIGQWEVTGKRNEDLKITSVVVYAVRVTWRKNWWGAVVQRIYAKSSSKCQRLVGSWVLINSKGHCPRTSVALKGPVHYYIKCD